MTSLRRERLLALLAAAAASAYVVLSRSIEDSLLSDAVGAGGVPQGVGIAVVVAAVALFARTWLRRPQSAPVIGQAADTPRGPAWPVIARTSALVAILLAFAALLPMLGYALSISALVLACGWLAGAAFKLTLWLCAAGAGPGLWLLFDRLLQVRMPVGTLWG